MRKGEDVIKERAGSDMVILLENWKKRLCVLRYTNAHCVQRLY